MDADIPGAVERGEVFVIEDGGEIAGFIVTYPKDDAQFIENVAVHPRYQGQGIGRRMLAFAEAEAFYNDLDKLFLYTNVQMNENLDFYLSLGFVETQRITEDGFERVYFEKKLAPNEALRKTMKDDPNQIAENLVKEYGLEGARIAATEGIAKAHQSGGLYELSIWREVRKIFDDH
jgi:N-acetylglutamate synthase-like GNAT family acetyltransferase